MSRKVEIEVEDDGTVKALRRKVAILKTKAVEMDFQIGAANDMSRIHIVSEILNGIASHKGLVIKADVEQAMEVAEMVMDVYHDIVEERKVKYAEAIEKIEFERAAKEAKGTVQ